jgi:hypothetical protein
VLDIQKIQAPPQLDGGPYDGRDAAFFLTFLLCPFKGTIWRVFPKVEAFA